MGQGDNQTSYQAAQSIENLPEDEEGQMIIPAPHNQEEHEMEDLSQPVQEQSDEEEPLEEEEKKHMIVEVFEVGEHIDCLDTYDKWLNAEVVQKRKGQLKVHYSGFAPKYDEWLPVDSPRLMKQWRRGKLFMINNRLDVQDSRG